MLPIYNSEQMREWDNFTINLEPITSIDLMERAATQCVDWILKNTSNPQRFVFFCGNGNNGGDGLAMARILALHGFKSTVYHSDSHQRSNDSQLNYERLLSYDAVKLEIAHENTILVFEPNDCIIDCIFGTGLNKPVEGVWKTIIAQINNSGNQVISIDCPSGLFSEPNTSEKNQDAIIKASVTLSLQAPKLSMLLPPWGERCGRLVIIDIGLKEGFVEQHPANQFYLERKDIQCRFKIRQKFSHKGTYGHALLIAGGAGKCGAGILSAKACIKSGAGLVSLRSDQGCYTSVYAQVPEIMLDESELHLNTLTKYSAIGLGPGMGIDQLAVLTLENILAHYTNPIVLDADAISILAQQKGELALPENTILTPHPKEFDRLVGESSNAFDRLQKAKQFASTHKVIMVLKGAYTAICSPDGNIYFNSTGNAGMATAGSGDVLTGIITSFLAQGYSPLDAAILGVYIHGWAGDLAAKTNSVTGMVASDIIEGLKGVFGELEG